MKLKCAFIMNPISGSVKKSGVQKLIDKFIDKDKYEYIIRYTEYAGHATKIASEYRDAGYDVVVAVGGDGTINEVGQALVHSNTAMGILPCGSGNGLARHLSIPTNLRKSIEILNKQSISTLDYCTINGHPFFCTCGMGFDAFISEKFAKSTRRGPVKYFQTVLMEGLRYKPETYTIEDESGIHRHYAYLVSCANASQYGNNAYIAPQAKMSDGLLDVIIMEPFNLLGAPHISFDMMNKTLNKSHKVKTFKAKKVTIHRTGEGPVHYDGEAVTMGGDIEVAVVEKGIKMVCNEEAERDLKPNIVQNAITELFNNMYDMGNSISRQGRRFKMMNKRLWRKLTK